MEIKMRVCVYSRVSTRDQDAENQLQQLRTYCERQGYEIVAEYVDTASGGKSDRVAFKDMFSEASTS